MSLIVGKCPFLIGGEVLGHKLDSVGVHSYWCCKCFESKYINLRGDFEYGHK